MVQYFCWHNCPICHLTYTKWVNMPNDMMATVISSRWQSAEQTLNLVFYINKFMLTKIKQPKLYLRFHPPKLRLNFCSVLQYFPIDNFWGLVIRGWLKFCVRRLNFLVIYFSSPNTRLLVCNLYLCTTDQCWFGETKPFVISAAF